MEFRTDRAFQANGKENVHVAVLSEPECQPATKNYISLN